MRHRAAAYGLEQEIPRHGQRRTGGRHRAAEPERGRLPRVCDRQYRYGEQHGQQKNVSLSRTLDGLCPPRDASDDRRRQTHLRGILRGSAAKSVLYGRQHGRTAGAQRGAALSRGLRRHRRILPRPQPLLFTAVLPLVHQGDLFRSRGRLYPRADRGSPFPHRGTLRSCFGRRGRGRFFVLSRQDDLCARGCRRALCGARPQCGAAERIKAIAPSAPRSIRKRGSRSFMRRPSAASPPSSSFPI